MRLHVSNTMSNVFCNYVNMQGPIHVTELSLGDEFPIFSNARIRPSDDIGSMVRLNTIYLFEAAH